ncbi:MAG: 23S rRNA (adenine(2503)-C(2))-methyltransferase RlmN [Acidimicrobiales bacterium]|jgi:23S rRNA (adenine2503-C2)-methyltransferase
MSRFDLSREELAEVLAGEPAYRTDQVWEGLHREHGEPGELTNLPKGLRARLAADERLAPAWAVVSESTSDRGATRKWLLEAADGSRVETVLMRYRERSTVCVSSQAGCAMGCSFCATGQLGFGRQLSSGEIVEQVVRASRQAEEAGWGRLGNVVLMGMGEPLANYEQVFAALRRCNEAVGIGARSMTVSTVGVVPGIVRMAAEPLQVNLAVSLHAANDALRNRLVPLNKRYPLGVLMGACEAYLEATKRRISFEWACIGGVNDQHADARELASLARPLWAHVNLIPLNPTPGYSVAGSSGERVAAFRDELRELGVNVTIRNTRGREVDAACGQLAAGLVPGGLRRRRVNAVSRREVAVGARLA